MDTPGHEAFCSMRVRGAHAADIAVLVVSAEDGVKPQTIEALKCINQDAMPFIVALNKIDRAGANIDKVKQNLAENEILVEGWGGTVPAIAISGKTGEGVPDLLEMIALQSDIEELTGDPSIPAEGFVIESNLDPKQGISATLLIKNEIIVAIANKYKKTVPQIILRWDYQQGIVSVPKSQNPIRLKENISIFDFVLSDNEIESIDRVNIDFRVRHNPDSCDFTKL